MKILVCVLFLLPAFVQADERLWGTWQGVDPEEEAVLILTFAEDGSFGMTSPDMTRRDFAVETLFEEMFFDLGLTFDELEELGFKMPVVIDISIQGRWEAQGDSIKVWVSDSIIQVEGRPPLSAGDFMLDVLAQIATLPLEQGALDWINALIVIMPLALAEVEGEEELIIEEAFYFLGDQLVLTDGDDPPLVLSRVDDPGTAVRSATWGQIKSRWP